VTERYGYSLVEQLLPEEILKARIESGLTLRQVAAKTGLSKDTVSSIERGTRVPWPQTLHALAEAYNVPIDRFLKSREEMESGKAPAPPPEPARVEEERRTSRDEQERETGPDLVAEIEARIKSLVDWDKEHGIENMPAYELSLAHGELRAYESLLVGALDGAKQDSTRDLKEEWNMSLELGDKVAEELGKRGSFPDQLIDESKRKIEDRAVALGRHVFEDLSDHDLLVVLGELGGHAHDLLQLEDVCKSVGEAEHGLDESHVILRAIRTRAAEEYLERHPDAVFNDELAQYIPELTERLHEGAPTEDPTPRR
jgi:transcriptional regulator with XRE-family HTH domain